MIVIFMSFMEYFRLGNVSMETTERNGSHLIYDVD